MTGLQGHILVVDDLETNRDPLVRALQKEGLTTDEARDGIEALEMLRKGSYDTILLDLMMPRMDGKETLTILKQDKELADIPVIMLSAANESKNVTECIGLGADDYLPKPIDRALLHARLASCLKRKHLQDQEREYLIRLESTNQELKHLSHLKSRFLAVAAHDLKNPMTTVLITVDKMLEMEEGTVPLAQQRLSARRIRDSVQRMLGIVQGLLDSAAYEVGSLEIHPRTLDLNAMVKAVVNDNQVYASSKLIRIFHFLPPDPVIVNVDERRIRETLENLINNAIKFSPLDREISVALYLPNGSDGNAVISVQDQGPGLTEEDLAHVFTAYQNLSAKPTGGEVSVGLGLSIVKQMIELHGGRVWVDSEAGKGATFFLELPQQRP